MRCIYRLVVILVNVQHRLVAELRLIPIKHNVHLPGAYVHLAVLLRLMRRLMGKLPIFSLGKRSIFLS